MESYDHRKIEKKWQEQWEADKHHTTPDVMKGKENFYTLIEFPYPSGNLHVGHWYAFSVPDIFVRYKRMRGFNVLYPIGFDAFGLPAENAAIKHKLNPREWTEGNIAHMREQLKTMGASFDWSREVITADPSYYRWTQWLFLQFFKKGLAYQKDTEVNWCPKDQTVLANEQVIAGRCERCESVVEKRFMKQWNLKITDYAERLLNDLSSVDYPEPIKEAQRNWIGKSEGVEIEFGIKNQKVRINVFTTRPDTIFGATYLVLAPEHEAVESLKSKVQNWDEVEKYTNDTKQKSEMERMAMGKEKTGVKLGGVMAINPANKEEIPVFAADYVLASYGTGAIMAVPAHDERDRAFAEKYNLPIRTVIDDGGALVESGAFSGILSEEVKRKIVGAVGGKMTTAYKMRDWVVSRQRYWGCPIPVVHCEKCGTVVVPESELPVVLPEIDDFLPAGDGKSPLAKIRDWVEVPCPNCGGNAERETDTLDTFIDSSWYYLRYTDPKNEKEFASRERQDHWMPVDFYSGGAEHTTMHLLYSRFFHKVLFDLGFVADAEPYRVRMNRGLILGPDGQKMSKRWGNVIDPDEAVARLGADTVRTYLAFIGPYNEVGAYPWNTDGIVGVRRFIERVWKLEQKTKNEKQKIENRELEKVLHQTIQKVGEEIESFKFNTAVSALMICLNAFEKENAVSQEIFETFLRLLAPFAPHVAEALWETLGHTTSIHSEPWPKYDSSKCVADMVTMGIQVNGKVRGVIAVARDTSEEEIKNAALKEPGVMKYLDGAEIVRTIIVPQKIVSLVVKHHTSP